MKKFYLTTTLPYVNAEPHIGFALEIVEADVICRHHRSHGEEVIFNTGTDEHGQKIYQKALENNQTPQEYCDIYAAKFAYLRDLLNLSYNHFIRTTDDYHIQAAQEFWRRSFANGDIYKSRYQVKYCVGCELEKNDSELENGRCPLHPKQEIELRDEENYFFRFSKYQQKLLEHYQNNPGFVQPASKQKEIIAFVQNGLKDFSISRLKNKMPWGIQVPDDPDHVMYVWFDALINYVSTIGWPKDMEKFQQFWPVVQLAGKDNLRQQAAMWQAMLFSAGLTPSQKILINGFIGVDGQKMSKSLGNVISPADLVEKYGQDATRFLLINLGTFADDMDVTRDKLHVEYTANLANGLGNLCSRVAKMAEKFELDNSQDLTSIGVSQEFLALMDDYQLTAALKNTLELVANLDKYLAEQKPWQQEEATRRITLLKTVAKILQIAKQLESFMPQTAELISSNFSQKKIKAMQPLFPRI
ncbi:MAG: methionine--tRNA ligase [Patescibacteria group bacterium]